MIFLKRFKPRIRIDNSIGRQVYFLKWSCVNHTYTELLSLQILTNISFRLSCMERIQAVRAQCCHIKENCINYLVKYFNHSFSESRIEFPAYLKITFLNLIFFSLKYFTTVSLLRVVIKTSTSEQCSVSSDHCFLLL